ncbi:DUF4124 domain-containing protein [Arenimonas aestuarii]
MNRLALSFLVATTLCAGLAHASEKTTVYKSKGASGENVYSQLEVSGAERQSVDAGTGQVAAETETPKTEIQIACERARANLELLGSDNRLQRDKDGDGEPEDLTPEERQAEKELAQRQITAYCEAEAE